MRNKIFVVHFPLATLILVSKSIDAADNFLYKGFIYNLLKWDSQNAAFTVQMSFLAHNRLNRVNYQSSMQLSSIIQ